MKKPVEERRKLLKSLVAGGAAIGAVAALPDSWKKPLINAVEVPLHAQSSVPPSFIQTISFAYSMSAPGGQPLAGTLTPGTTPITHLINSPQVLPGSTFDMTPTFNVNAGTNGTFTLQINEVIGGGDSTNFSPSTQNQAPSVNGVVPFSAVAGNVDNARYIQYQMTITPSNPAYTTYYLQVTFDEAPAGPGAP